MSNYNNYYGEKKQWYADEVVLIAVILIIGLVCVFGRVFGRAFNKASGTRTVTGTVVTKTLKRTQDGYGDLYLVVIYELEYGENIALEVSDSVLRERFDSREVYANIEIGKTYVFEVAGSSEPALDWYPNIYEFQEIADTEQET